MTTAAQGGIVYVVSGAGSATDYACSNAFRVTVSYCSQSHGLYWRVTVNGTNLSVEAATRLAAENRNPQLKCIF